MRRRELLGGSAAVLLGGAAPRPARATFRTSRRRVRPGDPGWPSAAQWEDLGRRVGGLVRPVTLWSECERAPRSAACLATLAHVRNPYFIGDQAGGTQVSGWLDAWRPAASVYGVAARSTADVVAAVNFARAHDLRLAVKGGGHSYQGTSNAPDSLLVWTRPMRAVTLRPDFVAEGRAGLDPPSPAVTIEAGAMWMDAYDAVTTQAGRDVQGGGCATVGVAGLVQGGGFGSFSKRFGTAAGSLVEAEIVTADGATRTVNASRHPDLFWAIKGGGGGTFGVVTRLTLKTHDLPEWFGWAEITIRAATDAAFARLIGRFFDFYALALFNPHWGEEVSIGSDNTLKITMDSQGLDGARATALWKPFLDEVAAAKDLTLAGLPEIGARPARGWWDAAGRRAAGSTAFDYDDRPGAPADHGWWSGDQDQVSAFLHGYDSLWLPASLLAPGQRGRLVEALLAASRHFAVLLHVNKGLAGAPAAAIEAARDTATNPAVLDAFALAIIATGGPPPYSGVPGPAPDMALAHRNAAAIDLATAQLRRVAPEAGSYVSESNYFNGAWRSAFWGANYARLRQVKARYDPNGLFVVHHGVGSEDWSADDFTRLA